MLALLAKYYICTFSTNSFYSFMCYFVLLRVCFWVHMCSRVGVEVRGQPAGVCSLPPPYGRWSLSLRQAWQQVPLPTETSRSFSTLLLLTMAIKFQHRFLSAHSNHSVCDNPYVFCHGLSLIVYMWRVLHRRLASLRTAIEWTLGIFLFDCSFVSFVACFFVACFTV